MLLSLLCSLGYKPALLVVRECSGRCSLSCIVSASNLHCWCCKRSCLYCAVSAANLRCCLSESCPKRSCLSCADCASRLALSLCLRLARRTSFSSSIFAVFHALSFGISPTCFLHFFYNAYYVHFLIQRIFIYHDTAVHLSARWACSRSSYHTGLPTV